MFALVAGSLSLAAGITCVVCGLGGLSREPAGVLPYLPPASTDAQYRDDADRPRPAAAAPEPKGTGARPAAATRREFEAPGGTIGTITIPELHRTLPIVQGTDSDDLEKGVGHYVRSVMPGASDNCVLSGHRDTVFAGLDTVGIGDRLVVRTRAGSFTYKVRRIRIVHKDDRTVIVPADHAVLTVTTCYPFHWIGPAPDRFVLVADLVDKA